MITQIDIYNTIIIGGGSAGLFCSATFPCPVKGLILEKTSKLGTKLLMSGSGQCNITHSGSIKNFISHYGSNGKKVRSCLYKQNNQTLMAFLEDNGVNLAVRDDGKVFPSSLKSQDILDFLINKSEANGFSIKTNAEILEINKEKNIFFIKTSNRTYKCENLVIATGGKSYPTTGSDGNFFTILKEQLNISVTDLKPSLVPIYVENYPYTSLSGISFSNVGLSLFRNDNKIEEKYGDLLFTHRNFSGPLILNFSREIQPGDKIVLNYLGKSNLQEIIGKINNKTKGNNKDITKIISDEFNLPKRFITLINDTTQGKVKEIAKRLISDTFIASGSGSFNVAMATCGGVNLSEINLTTMESKKMPNLYIIGEALDIDGDTGGYNLQFAYSSAITVNHNIIQGGKNDN